MSKRREPQGEITIKLILNPYSLVIQGHITKLEGSKQRSKEKALECQTR
jgi:hypothetical protein